MKIRVGSGIIESDGMWTGGGGAAKWDESVGFSGGGGGAGKPRELPGGAGAPISKTASGSVSASVLREAAALVEGDRNATHGNKKESFAAIAALWNAYMAARGDGTFEGKDVACMMTLLKIARRVQGKPIRDHYVDAAGYMGIAAETAGIEE